MQISVIVDKNRIPYILKVIPSNPHDSFRNICLFKLINKQKIMEEIIEENYFNKPINLIGGKSYIKLNE